MDAMPRCRLGALLITALAIAVLTACVSGRHSPQARNEASIVTLNLYHDQADWPKRRLLVIDALRKLNPDVIALQEVIGHETVRNQAEDIAQALGYQAYFVSTDPAGNVRRYGNAILTRHRILERRWKPLEPLQDSRTVAYARIDLDGTAVDVYATHLHHTAEGQAMRARQLRDLIEFIGPPRGDAPTLVAGDFNAVSGSPELLVLEARFANAHDVVHPGPGQARDATTLNPHFFPDDHRRIDHVYLQRDRLVPLESRIILDQPATDGSWGSDHFGLYVRFRIQPASQTPAPG